MDGAILIVARNCINLTKLAVKSAIAQDIPGTTVMVIDNASGDSTGPWLRTKDVCSITYKEQKPLSYCWNAGLRTLFSTGHDRVLVLNNDVQISPYMYRSLSEYQMTTGLGFVTGVSTDDPSQIEHPRPCFTELQATQRPHPDMSGFMIHKSVVDRVGWFDEGYFVYCEDLDMHVRMHRAGIEAVSIALPFYHVRSQTLKNANAGEQARIQRHADDSRAKFHKQYGCWPGSPEYESLFDGEII